MTKVGTIAYAAHSGLGNLVKAFYDNGIIDEVLICPHKVQGVVEGFYPASSMMIPLHPNMPLEVTTFSRDSEYMQMFEEFCRGIDVLFLFETCFWRNGWNLLSQMEDRPKIVLMPMYESTPFNWYNESDFYPDLVLCPSLLDLEYYKHNGWEENGVRLEFLNVPVDVEWRQREKAETFVHHAGNGSYADRNGTEAILEAMALVESPIKLRVNTQANDYRSEDPRVEIYHGTLDYEDLWKDGDVFLFPERFNGLSLPLQEARAAGMFVMCGRRFPIDTWVPPKGLIPVADYQKLFLGFQTVMSALYSPEAIAEKIDEIYGTDIEYYSLTGQQWATNNSWKMLGPQYKEYLESV